MKNKDRKFLGASIVFGILSAACCILPLIAALFGLSFLSVLAAKIENFRWIFITLAILFVGISGYWIFCGRKKCSCLNKKILIFVIILIIVSIFIFSPYILGLFLSKQC